MQCRQKYNREGGESAEQEQVSNTRTPSPSKGDAMLDFPFASHWDEMHSGYIIVGLGIWVLEIE